MSPESHLDLQHIAETKQFFGLIIKIKTENHQEREKFQSPQRSADGQIQQFILSASSFLSRLPYFA